VTSPPDIVLLGAEWPSRALLRAQLIEEGFDVPTRRLCESLFQIVRIDRLVGVGPQIVS